MISFWATLSLNIPDFSRYAKSQRDQVLGQALGLPPTMALYSFIGVAVTSATVTIYGSKSGTRSICFEVHRSRRAFGRYGVYFSAWRPWRPISPPMWLGRPMISHTSGRKRISFRTGGLITGVLGILIQPWKLIADPTKYIFTWLNGYSSLLGSVGGILIADYFISGARDLICAGFIIATGLTGTWAVSIRWQ